MVKLNWGKDRFLWTQHNLSTNHMKFNKKKSIIPDVFIVSTETPRGGVPSESAYVVF